MSSGGPCRTPRCRASGGSGRFGRFCAPCAERLADVARAIEEDQATLGTYAKRRKKLAAQGLIEDEPVAA